ncbi:MAG: carboxypeptidase-like regulatory domain-containing protein [Fulvivirga sp.]
MSLNIRILLLLLACGSSAYSQVIKGQILDHEGQPIPYANIGILDTQIGTASNEAGLFILFFSNEYNDATLQVSAISYYTFKVKISDIKAPTDYEIRLAPHYLVLDEIEISALDENAKSIVQKAVANIPFNYTEHNYQLQGFYRELLRNDDTYVALTEAAFTMDDRGYHKGQDKRLRLDELRKSNDMREMDELDIHYDTLIEGNDLARVFEGDYIDGRNTRYNFPFMPNLNDQILKNFEFLLDSMSYYNGQLVYCISFYTKKDRWFTSKSYEFNRMVITSGDYAVIEIHRSRKSKEVTYSDAKKRGNASYLVEGSFYSKSSTYYRKYKNKWYPFILTRHASVLGGDRQKSSRLAYERLRARGGGELNYSNLEYNGRILNPDKNNYYRHLQVLITSVSDHKDGFKKIRNKELMEKRKYVRSYSKPYNVAFWKDFNTIMRDPYLKATKQDLTYHQTLEEQFDANGY